MENKNYYFTYQYLCGDVIAILENSNGKQVACYSDYNGGWMGNNRMSYESFEALVENTTGRSIEWEWDELYQAYFPYLEAV